MKCNKGTDIVCTCYERCNKAWNCSNVPIGIRNKLNRERYKIKYSLEQEKQKWVKKQPNKIFGCFYIKFSKKSKTE